MIPLRIFRLLALLIGVSLTLALVEGLFQGMGLSSHVSSILSGMVAGGVVFLLAYFGGSVLLFCGKVNRDDPERRAKVRAALLEIGVLEERRSRKRKELPNAVVPERRGEERRGARLVSGKALMYVSIVESPHFLSITARSGKAHRAFISTGMIDALSPGALRGVLSHEYGHVMNGHPLKLAVILGLVAAVKMSVGIPLVVVLLLIMTYLYMLREWEYVADEAAVRRTSVPELLAAFDEYHAIEHDKELSKLSELFCAHPSTHRRIAAIKRLLPLTEGAA